MAPWVRGGGGKGLAPNKGPVWAPGCAQGVPGGLKGRAGVLGPLCVRHVSRLRFQCRGSGTLSTL